jgi:hypothetical protein
VLKNKLFAGILKVNDENIRIRIQDPDPNLDPDPLVRDMDPRIWIRIHPKMSWIRNTAPSSVVEPEPRAQEPKLNCLPEPEPKLRIAAPAEVLITCFSVNDMLLC